MGQGLTCLESHTASLKVSAVLLSPLDLEFLFQVLSDCCHMQFFLLVGLRPLALFIGNTQHRQQASISAASGLSFLDPLLKGSPLLRLNLSPLLEYFSYTCKVPSHLPYKVI